MDEKLFKEYEEWCKKENKDPLKEETIKEFKLHKEKSESCKEDSKNVENELVAKQKVIFKLICEYAGIKAHYSKYMFETIDRMCKSLAMASAICNCAEDD